MIEHQTSAAESVVRALFDAFVARCREKAEQLLSDDFTFTSPYDDGINRDAFFTRCWPNGDRFVEFQIERAAATPDGVFVTYSCTTDENKSFHNTEFLTVQDGKITSTEVYFGATYCDGEFVSQPLS
jgi:ketosteroid isomerase-like protein